MKRFVIAAVAAFAAGATSAAIPIFVATCPTDINVDSGRTGVVLINGQKATVKKINENNYDAKAGYITISVTHNPGKAPDVFYTGKGRANGVCTVTGFGADKGAAVAEPVQQQAGGASSSASGNIPCAQNKSQPMGHARSPWHAKARARRPFPSVCPTAANVPSSSTRARRLAPTSARPTAT